MKLNLANRITILRILLIVPFVGMMLKINDQMIGPLARDLFRYAATVIYLAMAISDALDGHLARKHNQTTKLGTFLDPLADKLLITCACLLLTSKLAGVQGFQLPRTVVLLIVGKDLFLLMGFFVVHMVTSQIHIVPVLTGKASTILQACMVTAVLIAPEASQLIGGWIWFVRFLWWSAAALAVLATLIYIRNGSRYVAQYELEQAENEQ